MLRESSKEMTNHRLIKNIKLVFVISKSVKYLLDCIGWVSIFTPHELWP